MKILRAQAIQSTLLILLVSCMAMTTDVPAQADSATSSGTFPGEKSTWRGFDRYDFSLDGRDAIVVVPKEVAPGTPWVWRARFFDDPPGPDPALLSRGFHLVYIDVADMFGNTRAVEHWNVFYTFLTERYGFAEKPALEGCSRGGLIVYNWAAANPDKVACIYADAPVCDIKSWPGGLGKGPGNAQSWPLCLKAWNLTPEQARTFDNNPIDHLEPIAKAKVSLLHVCGGADPHVRMDENTDILAQRYKKLGGEIRVILKPGVGHEHGLENPMPIVDFILKHTGHAPSSPPGVAIDHYRSETQAYIGNPSIAILPNGDYLASHDAFGPGHRLLKTYLFRSQDRGVTWDPVETDLKGQYESSLFVHDDAVYILGGCVVEQDQFVSIRRSTDGGQTWSIPNDEKSGRLAAGNFNAGATPVLVHNGRIWRAMEKVDPNLPGGASRNFRAFIVSAPVDADLLDAGNWTISNDLLLNDFVPGLGWLEGNVVADPRGDVVLMLRAAYRHEEAAVIHVSEDGKNLTFNPQKGFVHFPGGMSKFSIRYDARSKRYWSIVNDRKKPGIVRNVLSLSSSVDLITWSVESVILNNKDSEKVGFQYVEWLIDDDDIIAVSRTAFDGAPNFHDANYLTFHRVEDFRNTIKVTEGR